MSGYLREKLAEIATDDITLAERYGLNGFDYEAVSGCRQNLARVALDATKRHQTGQGRDSYISAMDTFADVDNEIERIRTAGRDYSISGIDRLCDFARAAWGRRELSSSQEELQKFEDHCIETDQLEVAELVCEAREEIHRLGYFSGSPDDFGVNHETHLDRLRKLAEALEQAERMGNSEDIPEGLRYIQISDTLAKQWVDTIREVTGDKYNQGKYSKETSA